MDGEIKSKSVKVPFGHIPLMTVTDLAKYLVISKSMVYKLVEDGRIPYIKIGKSVRFRQRDIKVWIESKRVEPEINRTSGAEFEREVDKLLRPTTIRNKL